MSNLFVKPIKISKAGNDAVMEFGYALYKGYASFTFPKAENLKETPIDNEKGYDVLAQLVKPDKKDLERFKF